MLGFAGIHDFRRLAWLIKVAEPAPSPFGSVRSNLETRLQALIGIPRPRGREGLTIVGA